MARTRAEQVSEQRKTRVKWGDARLELTVDSETVNRLKSEGKVPRWVNDDGKGRIEKMQQRGYDFVPAEGVKVGEDEAGNADMGSRVSRIVGTQKDGKPLRAFLMVQSTDYYEEDQKEKEKVNKKVDDAIRRGQAGGPEGSFDDGKGNKTYVKGETKYNP